MKELYDNYQKLSFFYNTNEGFMPKFLQKKCIEISTDKMDGKIA
jgi:hypothetical protein